MRDRVKIQGRWMCWGMCAILSALSLGCGGGEKIPDLYPVSGKVTYNGKPVPGAIVAFFPDVKVDPKKADPKKPTPKPSTATADDDGNYVLYWNGGDNEGAPEGKYKVSIVCLKPYGPGDDTEEKAPSLIPERYGNPNTSGLNKIVKDDDNTFNFDLDDSGAGGAAPQAGSRDE
jgi:hypothetical protein